MGPHLTKWERWAVVTETASSRTSKVFRIVAPGEVKVIPAEALDEAPRWGAAF